MRTPLLAILVALGAVGCAPNHSANDQPDAPTIDAIQGDPCTGDVTRCDGGAFQKCTNGFFETSEQCANTCSATLGCVACDPAAGSNACNGNDVATCNADGSFGTTVMSCGAGTACSGGACNNVCTADGVDLVYVVDEQNDFMSFDPRKLPGNPFTLIGQLSCPTTGGTLQVPAGAVVPMSMGIDRDGKAWVEYTSGEVFNVSLTTAACTATGYTPRAGGMDLFGMGFVTDTPGGMTEKLFIAGGGDSAQPNGKLASIDTHGGNLTPAAAGTLTEPSDFSPELTGTNEAKLYGFFPVLATPAYVQEIDRTTGAGTGTKFNLGTTGLGTAIRDWAFAQWGGVFYVFVTTADGNGTTNSTVRAIDRATGTYTVLLQNLAFNVDGAGVSTCAPSVVN